MKMSQKMSFMVLGLLLLIMGSQNYSYADPSTVSYRMLQEGTHILPLQSSAASMRSTLPYPPNENCGGIAGEINNYVKIPLESEAFQTNYHCYSLYKGFWHYAFSAPAGYTGFVSQSDVQPIPRDSIVTVRSSSGSSLSGLPVRVVNPGLRNSPVSLDVDSAWLPRFDTDYKLSYSAMFNEHGYTTKDLLRTNSSGKFGFAVPSEFPVQAIFATKYKGFWHYGTQNIASFPASQTLTMPVESRLTLNYLGNTPANIQVMVADPIDDQKLLSPDRYATNSAGTVSYAIPVGTEFRFAYYNDKGNILYSQVLTAPFRGSVIVRATDNPELFTPAANSTVSTGQMIRFEWGNTTNAAKYLWFYRYNNGSWYYIDRGSNTAMNLTGLPNAGKWDWMVMALDSAGKVIAESEVRPINVVAAAKPASAKRPVATPSVTKDDAVMIDFRNKSDGIKPSISTSSILEKKKVVLKYSSDNFDFNALKKVK